MIAIKMYHAPHIDSKNLKTFFFSKIIRKKTDEVTNLTIIQPTYTFVKKCFYLNSKDHAECIFPHEW